uniref:Uncharacterized protein n=1 Tax=Panagrolaimus davidi TaxID=227884 RepID=A0A914PWU7_9BILA
MKFQMYFVFIALFGLTFLADESNANPISDCWNQWSRCTKWSSDGTGVLWQECGNHCKSMGYAEGGSCVDVTSECFLSETAYQCQCRGTKG